MTDTGGDDHDKKKGGGAVIFLHGSGDSGGNLQSRLRGVGFERELASAGYRLVCPTAKTRPYTLAGGMPWSVWFDRKALSPRAPEDEAGIQGSYQQIVDLITGLAGEGIPSDRVYVGGFSMGGGMALQFLARYRRPLAGVFAMSSFLSQNSAVYAALRPSASSLPIPPILIGHGEADGLVRFDWGLSTARRLHSELASADTGAVDSSTSSSNMSSTSANGAGLISFFAYPGVDHELSDDMLQHISAFVTSDGASPPATPQGGRASRRPCPHAISGPSTTSGATSAVNRTSSGAAAEKGAAEELLGISVEALPEDQGANMYKATVLIPPGRETYFLQKPVMTRGASFSFEQGPTPGSICTTFMSPSPDITSQAIAAKVAARLKDPEPAGMEEACRQS